jgi:hypothetical protein
VAEEQEEEGGANEGAAAAAPSSSSSSFPRELRGAFADLARLACSPEGEVRAALAALLERGEVRRVVAVGAAIDH